MLELACVAILCDHWKPALQGTVTLVRCDNMAAVHCIRRGFCGSIRMARVLAPLFSLLCSSDMQHGTYPVSTTTWPTD